MLYYMTKRETNFIIKNKKSTINLSINYLLQLTHQNISVVYYLRTIDNDLRIVEKRTYRLVDAHA